MSTAVAPVEGSRTRSPLTAFTNSWASQIGITVAFLALWIAFIVGAPTTFLSDRIYLAFAQTTPYFAIVALFLTMVIIAGDIDLSFISIMSLSMVGFVFTWQATGSTELGVVACVAVGALCGLFNGFFVTIVGIPALVVTIGTQFLFAGHAEFTRRRAGRDDERAARHRFVVEFYNNLTVVFFLQAGDVAVSNFSAEPQSLFQHKLAKFIAADAIGEAGIIVEAFCGCHLAAGRSSVNRRTSSAGTT